MILRPKAEFDPLLVCWGGPGQPRTDCCSYCSGGFRDNEVPLILGTEDGWVAEFCEGCQRRYWGFEVFPPSQEDEDDDPTSL
jgi:hypothetical protein